MVEHRHGLTIPFDAGVFEVANEFFLLGVHTDHGEALGGILLPLSGNVEKLSIAIRVLGGGDLFAVDAQFEIHLLQQAADRILAHGDSRGG